MLDGNYDIDDIYWTTWVTTPMGFYDAPVESAAG